MKIACPKCNCEAEIIGRIQYADKSAKGGFWYEVRCDNCGKNYIVIEQPNKKENK